MPGIRTEKNAITNGVIWKQLILFFIPIFLQSVFQQLFSITDAIIVGQVVGKAGLGAINSTSNLIRLFINLFVGLCSGAAIVVGQSWGAEDWDKVSRCVHTGVTLSLAGGVLLAAVCVALTPVFMWVMRIPADMRQLSSTYTWIYFLGIPGTFVYNMTAGVLRAIGDSKRPFYYLIASLIVNILLDLALVMGLRTGVAGAAVATAAAQYVCAGLTLLRLCRAEDASKVRRKQLRIWKTECREMVKLGVPIALQGMLYSISNIALQSTVNSLGTDVIAAWGVHVKIDSVIWSVYDAFGIASSTFAAQNYGAGKLERVRKSIRTSLVLGLIIIVALSALIWFFVRPLSRLFVGDDTVIGIAAYVSRLMAPWYFFYLFGTVLSASIRGCGETFRPMILTLIGTCGFRLLWVAAVHLFGGPTVVSVAWGYPASWFFQSLLFVIYYFTGKWRSRLYPAAAS